MTTIVISNKGNHPGQNEKNSNNADSQLPESYRRKVTSFFWRIRALQVLFNSSAIWILIYGAN
jgi:hypothetical protein